MISIDYDSLRKKFRRINMYESGTDLMYIGKIYDNENKIIDILNTGSSSHICFGSLLNTWDKVRLLSRPVKSASFYIAAPTVQKEHSLLYTWMSSNELKEFVSKFAEEVLDNSLNIQINVEKGTMFTPLSDVVEIRTSDNIRRMELKLLLFWLRNAIKFPYNYLLADAITLKEKYLPEEELYNLLRVVIFSVKPSKSTEVRYTFDENFSPWGPILDLQKFKKEIRTKRSINYWRDGGIFPGAEDLRLNTPSKQKLLDEKEFRYSILEELPYMIE